MRFQTAVELLILLVHITRVSGLKRCTTLDKNNLTVTQQMYYAGNSYNLQCCFSGYQITWMKNDRPLNKVDILARRYEFFENNKTLLIYSLIERDTGNYTCIVKRLNTTSRIKTILFKVVPAPTKKPVFSVRMLNIPVVPEGENVSLECYITSGKRPGVFWYKVNYTAKKSDGSYSKTFLWRERPNKESDLFVSRYKLTNVTVGDSGVYECMAFAYDPYVREYENITLNVEAIDSTKDPGVNTNDMTPLIIGIVIASVLLLAFAAALGTFCWFRRKSNKETDHDAMQPLIRSRSSCRAIRHNSNARDDKGDDNCICYEVKDVFISYNSKDGDWVSSELLPKLKENYKVCWDVQDFKAGDTIMDNIANSIWRSRKTLLVITKNFLESNWTKFEMTVAQGRDITEEENILIMIVVEELEQNQLPPKLMHYYKSRTYLEWCNEKVKPHFWERLRCAIGPSLTEFDVINGNAEGSTDTDASADAGVNADAGVADAVNSSDMNENGHFFDGCPTFNSGTYPETIVTIGGNADANADTLAKGNTNADAGAGSDIIAGSNDGDCDNKIKFSVDAGNADADAPTGVHYKGALCKGNAAGNGIRTVGAKKIADADCNGTVDMK